MGKMNFQKNVIDHLTTYKKVNPTLSKLKDGTFRNGAKKYPHILELKDIENNFIDPTIISNVVAIQTNNNLVVVKQNVNQSIHLHQFAHHLNSSQIMCINFFAPFFAQQQAHILLKVLGLTNPSVGISEFEFEHIENGKEKTNFDFYFKTKDGQKIFFEIKYTEQEFSRSTKANNDSKKRRWENLYSLVAGKNQHFNGLLEDVFYSDYQIFRDLFYANPPSDFVLFIVPRANVALVDQLNKRNISVVLSNNAKVLLWEDIVSDSIQEFKNNKYLHDYYIRFRDKYLL